MFKNMSLKAKVIGGSCITLVLMVVVGIIGVRAMYSVDVGIRLPAAFSRADTIT